MYFSRTLHTLVSSMFRWTKTSPTTKGIGTDSSSTINRSSEASSKFCKSPYRMQMNHIRVDANGKKKNKTFICFTGIYNIAQDKRIAKWWNRGESNTCLLFKSSFKSSHFAFWRANRLIFCWSSSVMWMSESFQRENCKNIYYFPVFR